MANTKLLKQRLTSAVSVSLNKMKKGYNVDLSKIVETIYAIEYVDNNTLEDYEKNAIISYYSNYV